MRSQKRRYLAYVIFNGRFKLYKRPLSEEPVIFKSIDMILTTFGLPHHLRLEVDALVPYRGLLIRSIKLTKEGEIIQELLDEQIAKDIWCDIDEHSNRWACYDQIGDKIGGNARLGLSLDECLEVVGDVCDLDELAAYVVANEQQAHVRPIRLGKLYIRMVIPMEIEKMISITRPLIPTFKRKHAKHNYMIFNNGAMEVYESIAPIAELFGVTGEMIQVAIDSGNPIKGTHIYHGEIVHK